MAAAVASASTYPPATSSYYPPTKSSTRDDRFYGYRDVAELCERFIVGLFACPVGPIHDKDEAKKTIPRLAEFVAYALHRTRLPEAVTHLALFLLNRLKTLFPSARGSSGHRLFLSALMIGSKVACDDTYSNKSWCIVGQQCFGLREVNQMEREMCGYLGWRVGGVTGEDLERFWAGVQRDYGASAAKKTASAPSPSPSPSRSTDTQQAQAVLASYHSQHSGSSAKPVAATPPAVPAPSTRPSSRPRTSSRLSTAGRHTPPYNANNRPLSTAGVPSGNGQRHASYRSSTNAPGEDDGMSPMAITSPTETQGSSYFTTRRGSHPGDGKRTSTLVNKSERSDSSGEDEGESPPSSAPDTPPSEQGPWTPSPTRPAQQQSNVKQLKEPQPSIPRYPSIHGPVTVVSPPSMGQPPYTRPGQQQSVPMLSPPMVSPTQQPGLHPHPVPVAMSVSPPASRANSASPVSSRPMGMARNGSNARVQTSSSRVPAPASAVPSAYVPAPRLPYSSKSQPQLNGKQQFPPPRPSPVSVPVATRATFPPPVSRMPSYAPPPTTLPPPLAQRRGSAPTWGSQ